MEEAKLKQTLAPKDFHIGRADTSSNTWIVWRPQYTSEMAQTQNVHFPSISYYFHIPKNFHNFFPHTGKNRIGLKDAKIELEIS